MEVVARNPKQYENDQKAQENAFKDDKKYLFWFVDKRSPDGSKVIKINIDSLRLIEIIYAAGYRRFDIDQNEFILVHIKNNIIKQVSKNEIQDYFINFIEKIPADYLDLHDIEREVIKRKIYTSPGTYFNEAKFSLLKPKQAIKFNEDTKNTAFFYYKNGYIEVTAQGAKFNKYTKLKNQIWEGQILQRNISIEDLNKQFDFYKFLNNIANQEPERLKSLKTLIGYGLHKFYDYDLKAIVLTDSRISTDHSGRSGKGLTIKSLGFMLNATQHDKIYCEIRGKYFNLDKEFRYQEAHRNTKTIHLNDIVNNKYRPFNIEKMYNDIDSGISVELKGQTPFSIWVKIFISTNRTLQIEGDSQTDRFTEFELADHYSANHKPQDEFTQQFFRDWTPEQWNQFDNIMFNCVATFLKNGIIKPAEINLKARKLLDHTHENFVEFMNGFEDDENKIKRIELNTEYKKADLYTKFREVYPDWNNPKFTNNKFTRWLQTYANYTAGIKDIADHLEPLQQRKAGANSYIRFLPINHQYTPDELYKIEKHIKPTGKTLENYGLSLPQPPNQTQQSAGGPVQTDKEPF